MLKHILAAAIAATATLGSFAQETMYLIKGDHVVAKYNVDEVDYASFKLPEGVTDIVPTPPSTPVVVTEQYLGAAGLYFGTLDDVADYQVQLSTRPIYDENLPVSFLYLQFMGPAADFHDLHLEAGTYTLGTLDDRKPFTFYAGMREITSEGEGIGGTIVIDRPDPVTTTATLVTDGQFTVSATDKGYKIAGMLKLETGNVLEFDYEGACVIDNKSDEQDPAEELPVPASQLTSDVDFPTFAEVYTTVWSNFFADMPRFDYVYIDMCADNTYSDKLTLGLIVDREQHPGVLLPKGKYPIVDRANNGVANSDLAALAAFKVLGETTVAEYGCWCAMDFVTNPLVAGEVEVLEDATDLSSLKLRVTLRDNAPEPHTVTATYDGPAEMI